MAKSNAERQAAYRARQLHDERSLDERLNTMVSVHAKRALERLAACSHDRATWTYGVTQRSVLERLLKEAESELVSQLIGRETDYYERRLRLEISVTQ